MGTASRERLGVRQILQNLKRKLTGAAPFSWQGLSRAVGRRRNHPLGKLCLLTLGISAPGLRAAAPGDASSVWVIVGAPGEADYRTNFLQQSTAWTTACEQASARCRVLDGASGGSTNQLEMIQMALEAEPKGGSAPLWLVLIGHGTFNGKEALMNLVGPDLSSTQLSKWLVPFERPLVLVNTASSSAPFLKPLSRTNRVVITSTRSGFEQNYSRFGSYFARAVGAPEADLDHDGQTSVLEAFLSASHQVTEFYQAEGRLMTEHALIDDNGDGLGTPAEWFRGIRATRKAKEGLSLDGTRAHQLHLIRSAADRALSSPVRERRDALELAVARLRDTKAQVDEEKYYARLEELLLELAALYEGAGAESSPEKK